MSPDEASSPASSCLDDSVASSLGTSVLPGSSNNAKILTSSLLLKDAINSQNEGISLETINNTVTNNTGIDMLNLNRNSDINNVINTMPSASSCPNSTAAATAALVAVAARIDSTPSQNWPYGVNAAAAAASSMFTNYYTASM